MALYGHEIHASITPSKPTWAGSSSWTKAISSAAPRCAKQKEAGVTRKLIGFEMRGRGIGRDGYEVLLDGAPAGWVTSGSPVAHAEQEHRAVLSAGRSSAQPGRTIQIMIRNQPVEAVTVPTPFYKRAK